MPQFLACSNGRKLAFEQIKASNPGVIFLGGFKSDMTGTKAVTLQQWAETRNRSFIRFDYSGHGQSSEQFEQGNIGSWLEDAQAILDQVALGPQYLVGSSMGGWIALLLAINNPQRIQGLLTIACATDFTNRLIAANMTPNQRQQLQEQGQVGLACDYESEPYIITRQLLDEGQHHLLLNKPIPIQCPVRMIHGTDDADVPWSISLETMQRLQTPDVNLQLIKGGDHRLSSPDHLRRMLSTLDQFLAENE